MRSTSVSVALRSASPRHLGLFNALIQFDFARLFVLTLAVALAPVAKAVLSPPTINTQPADISLVVGQTQNPTLSVVAVPTAPGTGPLSYQWRRNGVILAGQTAASYTVASATMGDADSYDVVVTDTSNSTSFTSNVARISVAPTSYPGRLVLDDKLNVPFEREQFDTFSSPGLAQVQALAGGKFLAAGSFTRVSGTPRARIARFNANGLVDTSFVPADINGDVTCFAVQAADGKIVIGGNFFRVGTASYNNLARLNADGSPDTGFASNFNTNASLIGSPKVIVVQPDGKILLGGSFFAGDNASRNGLFRLNSDGSLDTGFDAKLNSGATVRALAIETISGVDNILVGGSFSTVGAGAVARGNLARLDPTGALDAGFLNGTAGASSQVNAIVLDSTGGILIGGLFTTFNGGTAPHLARLAAADGARDPTFTTNGAGGANGVINAIALQSDGRILLGGFFTAFDVATRNRFLCLNANGSIESTFDLNADSTVTTISVQPDGNVLLGGSFVNLGGVATNRLARVSSAGVRDAGVSYTFLTAANVNALVYAPGGAVLVGGSFTHVNGVAANAIARLSANGSPDLTYNNGNSAGGFPKGANVSALAGLGDGRVYVAGGFPTYNGTGRFDLARLNADGTLDTSFDPGSGPNGPPAAILALPGGQLLLAGGFSTYNSVVRNGLVRLNLDGSIDEILLVPGGSVPGNNLTLARQPDGHVLVGGAFNSFAGTAVNNLARLNFPDGSVDATFTTAGGTGANGTVMTIATLPDGRSYVAGSFTSFNGVSTRQFIVRLDANGAIDTNPFATPSGFTSPFNNDINSVIVQADGRVIVRDTATLGGGFPNTFGYGRLNTDGSGDASFSVNGINSTFVNDRAMLLLDDGTLLVGGGTLSYGGPTLRYGLAHLIPFTVPTIATQPQGQSATVGANVPFSVAATGGALNTYGWKLNGVSLANNPAKYLGLGTNSLTVVNAQLGDVGTYTVTVTNALGSATSNVVTLSGTALAPTITTQPAATPNPVTAGSSVTLSVIASGTPTYQWRRNGFPINGAVNASALTADLTINSASVTDADLYDVIVADGLSTTPSQPVRLTVAPTAYPQGLRVDSNFNPIVESNFAQINAIAVDPESGQFYAAGSFDRIKDTTGAYILHRLARFNADGTFDASWTPDFISSQVSAVAVQPDGNIVIGGQFSTVGGQNRNRYARLNAADGSLDVAFAANSGGANGTVNAVAIQHVNNEDKVLLGGVFTTINGTPRNGLARLNADGTLDLTFNPAPDTASVFALLVQPDGSILVGGTFAHIGGAARNNLALLNPAGTANSTFAPTSGPNNQVSAIMRSAAGQFVVGGAFTSYDGTSVGRIARIDPTTGALDGLFATNSGSGFDGAVVALTITPSNGDIIAAGSFTHFNSIARNGLAWLNSGTLDTFFNPTPTGGVINALAVGATGHLIIGGSFTGVSQNGNPTSDVRKAVARFEPSEGGLDSNPAVTIRSSGTVMAALLTPGGGLVIAGTFDWVNDAPAGSIAKLTSTGASDGAFLPGTGFTTTGGAVTTITGLTRQGDGKMIAFGAFSGYNGTPRNSIVRLNANGTLDPTFTTAGSGINGSVNTVLPLGGGRLVVTGTFTNYNGTTRNGALRLNADGSLDSSFDPLAGPTGGSVSGAALLDDGRVMVFGNFTSFAGSSRAGLARLTTTGADDGFNPGAGVTSGFSPSLNTVVLQPDGRVLLGGNFTAYNSASRPNVARALATGVADTSFIPNAAPNGTVTGLVLQPDGRVLLRGSFNNFGSTNPAHQLLARLNADGSFDPSLTVFGVKAFTSNFGSIERATLVLDDGGVILGGNGFNLEGQDHFGLIRLMAAHPRTIDTQPLSQTVTVGASAMFTVEASGDAPITYQWRKNGVAIDGATDTSYTIGSTIAADAGNYDVQVTNVAGTIASNVATLTVNTPPVIVGAPAATTAIIGGTLTLSVSASGTPPFTYDWRFNHTSIGAPNSPTYTLNNFQPANAGSYDVVISNSVNVDGITSAPVVVSAAAPASTWLADPAFTRPELRQTVPPSRVTTATDGSYYVTWNNGSNLTGVNNARVGAIIHFLSNGTRAPDFNPGASLTDALAVVVQPNSQLLVGGVDANEDFDSGESVYRVFRLNTNGTRDPSYQSPAFGGLPRFMTLQSDGKLLVTPGPNVFGNGISTLARLNTDGSLDSTFFQPFFDSPAAFIFAPIVVDGSGGILIGGTFRNVNGTPRLNVARLNANGSLDTSFVPSGYTTSGNGTQIRGLALQTQGANAGKILIAGGPLTASSASRPVLRLNANGSLDDTFHLETQTTAGMVVGPNTSCPRGLVLNPANDGFTIVGATVTRFNADGTFDTTNFTRPIVVTPSLSEFFWLERLADGSMLIPILEFGSTINGTAVSGVAHLNANGSLDTGFNLGTFQRESYRNDLSVQSDSRPILFGPFDTVNTTAGHVGLARFSTTGSLDPLALTGVPNLLGLEGGILRSDGRFLVGVTTGHSALDAVESMKLFNANGTPNNSFALDATALAALQDDSSGVEFLADDRMLVAAQSAQRVVNGGVYFRRLNADGTLDNTFTGLPSANFGAVYRDGSNHIAQVVVGVFKLLAHYPDGRSLVLATSPFNNDWDYPQDAATLDLMLLRLNADGTLNSAFNPSLLFTVPTVTGTASLHDPLTDENPSATNSYPVVQVDHMPIAGAIVLPNGQILIGGEFTSIEDNFTTGLARLADDGSVDYDFSVGTGPELRSRPDRKPTIKHVAVAPDGRYWVTGVFDTFNGYAAPGVVRLNTDGSVDPTFATDVGYRSFLGDETKVQFAPDGSAYLAGTYAKPGDVFPYALTRLVSSVPVIGTQPKSQAAASGDSVTFSVSASGTPAPSYQWYKDSDANPVGTGPTFTISHVDLANLGSYFVVVSNANGSIRSNSVTVIVNRAQNLPAALTASAAFTPLFEKDGGHVDTMKRLSDGKVYLAGNFTSIDATPRPGLARLNAAGSLDTGFKPVPTNGSVRAFATQGGNVVIVGDFTSVGGFDRGHIARLNADGSLDLSFASAHIFDSNDSIDAVAIQSDGKIVVAGGFYSSVNIFRLNADGSVDTTFGTNLGTGFNSSVYALALQPDGKIVVGGAFTSFGAGGVAVGHIARLNSDGSLDSAFVSGTGFNSDVNSLGLQSGGYVIAGGAFTSYNGTSRNYIARLAGTNAVLDTAFDAGNAFSLQSPNLEVETDDSVLVVGYSNSQGKNVVTRLLATGTPGTPDPAFAGASGFSSGVKDSVQLATGQVLVNLGDSGNFYVGESSTPIGTLVRLSSAAALDTTYQPALRVAGEVYAIAPAPGGKWVVGGYFDHVNGVARDNLARLKPDGSLDDTFMSTGSGFDYDVYAVLVQPDGKVIAGGGFTSFNGDGEGGNWVGYIARLNDDGTFDTTFNQGSYDGGTVVGEGFNDEVYALAFAPDGKIYATGYFDSYNSYNRGDDYRQLLMRLNTDGTFDDTFDQPNWAFGDNWVYGNTLLVAPTGDVYVGGSNDYSSSDGLGYYYDDSRNVYDLRVGGLVRFKPDGALDTGFNDGSYFEGSVSSLALQPDGKLVVGGDFSRFYDYHNDGDSEFETGNVARLNSDGSLDAPQYDSGNNLVAGFAPTEFVSGSESGVWISSLLLQPDGKIIVGGDFVDYGFNAPTVGVASVARLNANGTIDRSFRVPSFYQPVDTMQFAGPDTLLIGGAEMQFPNRIAAGLALLEGIPDLSVTATPTNTTVIAGAAISLGLTTAISPTPTFQWLKNGVPVAGATGSTLSIANATAANSGNYALAVTTADGTFVSPVMTFTVIGRTLLNLMSTINVPAGGSVGASFTIEGATAKHILIRGLGPFLSGAPLNLTGVLADPQLTLFDASDVQIATNDDWGSSLTSPALAAAFPAVGALPLADGSKDAALLVTLVPGTYTARLDGVGGISGNALLEIYDTDTGEWPRLVMLTLRGPVTGANHLVVGLNLTGPVDVAQDCLIRVMGPSLGSSDGVLSDPVIGFYHGEAQLGSNDDWGSANANNRISDAVTSVGAQPSSQSYDSALLLSLVPGSYTAEIRPYSPSYESGEVLFEIFNVDSLRPATIAPAITYLASNQGALPGDYAYFGVNTVAKPAATFQWRKYVNGLPVPISGATAPILTLDNVQAADATSYDVVITSGLNTITSPTRTLTLLANYHFADTDHDGRIDLVELTRVIQLYNYLDGTVRTGQYHPQGGTEDGFAPGPGNGSGGGVE